MAVEPVKPGEWIRIPVPGDPWPVRMSIDGGPLEPAFIDHEPSGTVVQIRCPAGLRPGVHRVSVHTSTGIHTAKIITA